MHPDLQRFLAKRMNATTIETDSSHVITLSQPDVVIEVIRKAAAAVQKRFVEVRLRFPREGDAVCKTASPSGSSDGVRRPLYAKSRPT